MKLDFIKKIIPKMKESSASPEEPATGSEAIGNVSSRPKRLILKLRGWFTSLIAKRIALVLLFLIVLIQLGVGIAVYAYKNTSTFVRDVNKVMPFPVAMVNYQFVSYNDFLREQSYVRHFYSATKQDGINYQEVDKQILEQLIENKVIAQEAARRHISVSKSDVDATMNSIIEQNGGQDKVQKVLNDLYGLGISDFRRLVEDQTLREKVDNTVIARVGVRHILIRVDKSATQDQVTAAKTKIDGLLKDIKGGQDFAEVAKKNSEDVGSAENGGKLDPFAVGEMVKEFSDVAFKTKVGQISDPVRTEFGWHIIKVESRTGEVEESFADWIKGLESKALIIRLYAL